MLDFTHVKAGDKVTRLLAGSLPMELQVTSVDDTYIYCGPPGGGWKFLRLTGMEVDEELGWDGITHTGSYISEVRHGEAAASCSAGPASQEVSA